MSNSNKILIADLPTMYPKDLFRFEEEAGVWGRQYRMRRKQLQFAVGCAAVATLGGSYYTVFQRKNTGFVLFSTFSGFSVLGFCIGASLAPMFYPNVASNSETAFMRRVWWAQQCAKHWQPSQVKGIDWKAQYPQMQAKEQK